MYYSEMTKDLLKQELALQQKFYEEYAAKKVQYDMTRGKPAANQLDLSMEMLESDFIGNAKTANGTDCRNYGLVDGIPEAKQLMAELMGVDASRVIVGNNSSLNIMYDILAKFLLLGTGGGHKPWGQQGKLKFLCPCPGYDRHFSITEQFGIEMIPLELTPDGPDMDEVEALVAKDASIKGMWSIPKYSNPTGVVYSDNVITRLANMKCAADDFRIFWDDAYTVHFLYGDAPVQQRNLVDACIEAGVPNRALIFASTSKITFSGAGISAVASGPENISYLNSLNNMQTIGPDKLNQLRHAHFLKNYPVILEHMKKHAALIRPKFDLLLKLFCDEFENTGILEWTKPQGGYFISIDTLDGCADKVVAKAKACGLALTPAGSSYPYHKDPRNRNIRIAPTFPTLEELEMAGKILCVCIKICTLEKLLES